MIGWYILAGAFGLVCIICLVCMVTRPAKPTKFKCTTCGSWTDGKQIAYMAGDEEGCMEMLCWPCAEKAGKVLPKDFWRAMANIRMEEDRLDHRDNNRPKPPWIPS